MLGACSGANAGTQLPILAPLPPVEDGGVGDGEDDGDGDDIGNSRQESNKPNSTR